MVAGTRTIFGGGSGEGPINLFGGLFDRLASFSVGLGCGLGAGWYAAPPPPPS